MKHFKRLTVPRMAWDSWGEIWEAMYDAGYAIGYDLGQKKRAMQSS